jgi:uncharacterized protein (DUF1778 family)
MSSAYTRDTKVVAARVPIPVARLVEAAARAGNETVSDFVFSCVAPNLDEAALKAAQQQAANDRKVAE